jgi:hypothetical protein
VLYVSAFLIAIFLLENSFLFTFTSIVGLTLLAPVSLYVLGVGSLELVVQPYPFT